MVKAKHYKLKRSLSLFEATLYGVGIILGAGIYVLLGAGAGIAGNAIWISFIIAAIIAGFTGLSYAELSSRHPKNAAEYVYVQKAFKNRNLSFAVEWIMLFAIIISGATVALGFAGYFSYLFGGSPIIIASVLIVILSLINYRGIKESSRFNIISTLIEISGLLIVIIIGIFFIGKGNIDYFYSPQGTIGILSATTLIFFAYIGFEGIVNISEETKNAKNVMPKALILSLIISTILYILVSISAVSIVGWETLANSKAPVTDVVSTAIQNSQLVISIIALFATANTTLIIFIVCSRILYGLSDNHSLPKQLKKIGRTGTPYVAVFLVMVLGILSLFIGGIEAIALLTNVGIFTVYIFVNLSLIMIRYTENKSGKKTKVLFKAPLNIGWMPLTALLGLIITALMMVYFQSELIVYEIAIVIIGLLVYKLAKR